MDGVDDVESVGASSIEVSLERRLSTRVEVEDKLIARSRLLRRRRLGTFECYNIVSTEMKMMILETADFILNRFNSRGVTSEKFPLATSH